MSMKSSDFSHRVYDDGRTKQSFKDQCDVNKLLKKAARTGALSHLEQFGGQYGDFSDFDFMDAQNQLAKAREIFEALPAEVRRDFGQNPANFFEFANAPENVGRLAELLPEVAKPGDYYPSVRRTAATEGAEAPVGGDQGSGEGPTPGEGETPVETP